MSEKVLGYILISIGLVTIIFSAISVFRVFGGKAEPATLFNTKGIVMDISQLTPQYEIPSISSELEKLIGQTQPIQKEAEPIEILSAEVLNKSTNLFFHLMLMGFIASIGYKIASLGVQLTRPVVVKLKSKDENTSQQTPKQPPKFPSSTIVQQ